MPRPGYCRSTFAFISTASLDRATLTSQSAMYFFMKSTAFMSCVAPGPSWPGITTAGFNAVI